MKQISDTMQIGITFQMSLDAFLQDTHTGNDINKTAYHTALQKLEEVSQCRSAQKKQAIAKEALRIYTDCIEAYTILGIYEQDVYKKTEILKKGMELATMNLGKDFFLRDVSDFFQLEEAKPLFHIKFAYASALYENGYMRKAQRQFQELLNLNPGDAFQIRYVLMSIALYFEELEACRELLDKYRSEDTFSSYVRFLYYMKEENFHAAKQMIPILKEKSIYLYDMMTYRSMNTAMRKDSAKQGSQEEAGNIYHILSKVTQPMEHLHIFLVKNE